MCKRTVCFGAAMIFTFVSGLGYSLNMTQSCRQRWDYGTPGEDDDSYRLETLEFHSVDTSVKRYKMVTGDGDVFLMATPTNLANCEPFFWEPQDNHQGQGCGVHAAKNLIAWYGRYLDVAQAENFIFETQELWGDYHTGDSTHVMWLHRGLKNYFNAYFLKTDRYYQVNREQFSNVERIYEVLLTGHPVIVSYRVPGPHDKYFDGGHFALVMGAFVDDSNVGRNLYFLVYDYFDTPYIVSSSELQERMYHTYHDGDIVYVEDHYNPRIVLDNQETLGACAHDLAEISGNAHDYTSLIWHEDESRCVVIEPNSQDPNTGDGTVFVTLNGENTTYAESETAPVLEVKKGGDAYGRQTSYICDFYYLDSVVAPEEDSVASMPIDPTWDVPALSQPCLDPIPDSLFSSLNWGSGYYIGIGPVNNHGTAYLDEDGNESYSRGHRFHVLWKKDWQGVDSDGDGVDDYKNPGFSDSRIPERLDNCPDVPNADQNDCDEDGIGDVCDTDLCVDFCGDGVEYWQAERKLWEVDSPFIEGYSEWGSTPEVMPINYCTYGAGRDTSGQPASAKVSDVQTRWCSCEGYGGSDECVQRNCVRDRSGAELSNFQHSGWHLISWSDPTGRNPRVRDPLLGECSSHKRAYKPSQDCTFDSFWSSYGDDLESDYCTFHCGPEQRTFSNPAVPKYFHVGWDWRRELWWREHVDIQVGEVPQKNRDHSEGFIWLRPAINGGSGQSELEANKYAEFELDPGSARGDIASKPVPSINDPCQVMPCVFLPGVDRVVRWPDHVINPTWVELIGDEQVASDARMAVRVIPAEAAKGSGKFAYNKVPAEAAVGGLLVDILDKKSFSRLATAYSASAPGSPPPSGRGFALAQTEMLLNPPAGYGIDQKVREPVLVLFGGTLTNGRSVNSTWIGRLSGTDADGTPLFVWTDVTENSDVNPGARIGHALVADPDRNRLLLLGGTDSRGGPIHELWSFDLGTGQWSMLEVTVPAVSNFAFARQGDRLFVAGGVKADESLNTQVVEVDLKTLSFQTIADLLDGPGKRAGLAMDFAPVGSGKLMLFGGVDESGTTENDTWQLDLTDFSWTQTAAGCSGQNCPSGRFPAIMADRLGRVAVKTSVTNSSGVDFFVRETGKAWSLPFVVKPSQPTEMDCDGDGISEPETSRVCRTDARWYAEVGYHVCDPKEDFRCSTPDTAAKVIQNRWSPEDWEGIVDFAVDRDGITFVLTDMSLVVLDTHQAIAELQPIAKIALTVPGDGESSGQDDVGYALDLSGSTLYVGTGAGLSVYDISAPETPELQSFWPSYGSVRDIAEHKGILYLADGLGITTLDAREPNAIIETSRESFVAPVRHIDVDETGRRLYALSDIYLLGVDLRLDAQAPTVTDWMPLAGALYTDMKVDGRWIYLNGSWWNETYYHDENDGLVQMDAHKLKAWVAGRVVQGDDAYRVDRWYNRFEIWR